MQGPGSLCVQCSNGRKSGCSFALKDNLALAYARDQIVVEASKGTHGKLRFVPLRLYFLYISKDLQSIQGLLALFFELFINVLQQHSAFVCILIMFARPIGSSLLPKPLYLFHSGDAAPPQERKDA